MIKAVIFDMDGVVLDSEKYWPISDRKLYAELIAHFDPALLPNTMGIGNDGIHAILQRIYGLTLTPEEFNARRIEAALKNIYAFALPMPGFFELIGGLRDQGIRTALGTSSPRAIVEGVFKTHTQLARVFDTVVAAEDVGGRTKPFPDIFLKAAEYLAVEPQSCAVIEDADHGLAAAKAAGMIAFGFRNGINAHQHFADADFIISGFEELASHAVFSGAAPR